MARGAVPGLGCRPFQCQAPSVSACCSSWDFHPHHKPRLSPPPVPSGPSKADFPCRQGSLRGLQPGTGGKQGMQDEAEEDSEPASEAGGGSWVQASNLTENSFALRWRPEAACGSNQIYTRSWRIYLAPTNIHATRPLDINGTYSLTLWHYRINKTLKNVEAKHFVNQFNNVLFRHLQWT